MIRLVSAVVAAALVFLTIAAPTASAQVVTGGDDIETITLIPAGGSSIGFRNWEYSGTIEVALHPDGLSVVETVDVDSYLSGVREVPTTWPVETLKAQAVAARTYLAWTLDRGRTAAGTRYGYDICATTACQVYAGTSVGTASGGSRWLDAVAATGSQILLADQSPAQTLYSSSAGSRTRAVQDVFGGTAKPYLQPVDSPEAGVTPYEQWTVALDVEVFRRILGEAGFTVGADVRSITVDRPGEGEGIARLVVVSDAGRLAIPAVDVRWLFNGVGEDLYPGLLPATRPGGGRWPQAILSYTFDVAHEPGVERRFLPLVPSQDQPATGRVIFTGEGWGHGVGMSQWGAKALGDRGASYDEILGYYYGGLSPADGSGILPETVRVGLAAATPLVTFRFDGPVEVRVNGVSAGIEGSGEWSFRAIGGGVLVIPPPDQARFGDIIATRRWPR